MCVIVKIIKELSKLYLKELSLWICKISLFLWGFRDFVNAAIFGTCHIIIINLWKVKNNHGTEPLLTL